MRSYLAFCLGLVVSVASAQMGTALHGRARPTKAQWRTLISALRSGNGARIAAFIDPKGIMVRSSNLQEPKKRFVTRKEIVGYFARLKSSHSDPRGFGALAFTSVNLPAKMPYADAKGKYYFDDGHFDGRQDDSFVRFAVKNGKLWLSEVTAWAELGRMP